MSNPQGTHKIKNIRATNLYSLGTTLDLQNPMEVKSGASEIRFADGVEIGSSGTNTTNGTDIAIGKSATATGGNSTSVGQSSSAGGINSTAIGRSASAAGFNSIALGAYASATQYGSVAIGDNALSSGLTYSIAIGGGNSTANAANATGTDSIAIGRDSYASTSNSIAIGGSADATGNYALAAGLNVQSTGTGSVAIGGSTSGSFAANATGTAAVAIALGSDATSSYTIAIGRSADASGLNGTAIGKFSKAKGTDCVSIGQGSGAGTGVENIAIGKSSLNSSLTSAKNIAIGISAGTTLTSGTYNTLIGYNAEVDDAGATERIAIGYQASCLENGDIQLGQATNFTGRDAQMKFRTQIIGDESWIGGGTEIAQINATGDIIKGGTLSFGNIAVGNLDMTCGEIGNVESIAVNTMTSKDTGFITVNEPLVMSSTGDQIRFTDGIEIGNSTTNATTSTDIAIGKSAAASNTGAIAIGQSATAGNIDSIAIGTNIIANMDGGLFMGHRGPGAFTVNNAGFISGTNELVEVTSSRRFKQNIRDLEEVSDKFDLLRTVRYEAKPGHGDDREHIGLIAEEVNDLFPEFVTYDNEGQITGLVFDRMIAIDIKEIQALRKRMTIVENENENLKEQMQTIIDHLGL